MDQFFVQDAEEKLNNENLSDESVRRDLDERIAQSKSKLNDQDLSAKLEHMLKEETEKLHRQRRDYYAEKGDRKRSVQLRREKAAQASQAPPPEDTDSDMKIASRKKRVERKPAAAAIAYSAHVARLELKEKPKVGEGPVKRTIRLVRGLFAAARNMAGKPWYTHERKRTVYKNIVRDCWAPLWEAGEDMVDTAWNFLATVGRDFWDILLFLGDLLIKTGYYLWSIVLWIWDLLWDLRYKIDAHKHAIFRMAAFLIISGAAVAFVYSSSIGYEYSYYGKLLGVARTKEDVYNTISVLGDKLSEATGTNASIDVERDIEFNRIMVGFGTDVDDKEDILNTLTYMKDLQVKGYAISVDGRQQVILENPEVANGILDDILSSYSIAKSGVEYTSIDYYEDISVDEVNVLLGEVWNADNAEKFLKSATVATENGAEEDSKPLLNVLSTELSTYTEEIEFGTQYIDDASLYVGETELKSAGMNGVKQIVAEVSRVNGEEIGREVVSTSVAQAPVDQILYRGTKPIPAKVGTGEFSYPIKTYTISSRFGIRWGRMHTGVDFAAATGTKIYAADGGVVTFAGWKNSYGYIVMIDHGGLYETYYAHCSQILVSEGDNVYQGQNIALVGSTGNSTGPHLHFEIRYNGEPHNPLDYL